MIEHLSHFVMFDKFKETTHSIDRLELITKEKKEYASVDQFFIHFKHQIVESINIDGLNSD
jgi:hypothetical protein